MAIVPKQAERNFYDDATERLDALSFTCLDHFLRHLEQISDKLDMLGEDEDTVWYADIRSNLACIHGDVSQLHSKIRLLKSQKEVRESQKRLHNAMQNSNMSDEEKQTLKNILKTHGFLPEEKGDQDEDNS